MCQLVRRPFIKLNNNCAQPIGTIGISAPFHALFLRLFEQLFPLLNGFFNRTHIQESLFGQIIHLAIQNHTETFDRIFYGDHHTGYAGKLSATEKGCERNRCTRRARFTSVLSSSESSSIPKIEMISCNSLLR